MSQVISTVVSWAITTIFGAIASAALLKLKKERKKKREAKAQQEAHEDAQTQGMRSILRGEIIRSHEKYTERGFVRFTQKKLCSHSMTPIIGSEGMALSRSYSTM